MRRFVVGALLVSCVGVSVAAHRLPRLTGQGTQFKPVEIPRSSQYLLTSRINSRTYRIMVTTPFGFEPSSTYPVVYMLDANVFYATAAEAAHFQSAAKLAAPAIVVGVAYDTDDVNEWVRLRRFDFTPTPDPKSTDPKSAGGGDAFLRVVEEEIKPFVESRYKINTDKRTLLGMSFGGLIALRNMFRNPTAFSTYVLISPSIWWDNKAVLGDEDAFSKRARAGELALNIIVTSARDEQYRGTDPKLLAEAQSGARMVDNASELAARLSELNPAKVKLSRVIFDDEVHNTVMSAAISRSLRIALPVQ